MPDLYDRRKAGNIGNDIEMASQAKCCFERNFRRCRLNLRLQPPPFLVLCKALRTNRRKEQLPMLPAQLGTYYQAVVPDALDLAERARLSLNHLTSVIREELDYEMCWVGVFDRSAAPSTACRDRP